MHEMAPDALHAWKQRVRDWEAELEARGSAPETRDDPAGRWDDVVGRRVFLETAELAGDGEQLTVGPCS